MDRVSVLPLQRVNIADYEDGAGGQLVQQDQLREGRVFILPSGRTTGAALTQARILGGFNFDSFTAGVSTALTLNRGRALVAIIDDNNTLRFGLIQGDEGVATASLDFSGAAAASTQAVYIRATMTQATFQNRAFWNPSGAPSVELTDNVSTRKVGGWEATFQEVSVAPPGNGEWVKIAQVLMDGASKISTVTDYRHLYFEGDAAAGTAFDTEWGGGTDRNAARAAYGIADQHMWTQAVRGQLQDIIGTKWYTAPPTTLLAASKIVDNFVTIDKPGGAGADGNYATINAAVTALNLADGGTILLREGTYVLTAALVCTKQINFLAVETGVILENKINLAATWLIDFNSGAANSYVKGITFTNHLTDSSERMIVSRAVRIRVEQCNVGAEVSAISGDITVVDSSISDALEFDWTGYGVYVSGACHVRFERCELSETNGIHPRFIYLTALTAASKVVFEDCKMNHGSAGILLDYSSGSGDVIISKCLIEVLGNTITDAKLRFVGTGNVVFERSTVNVELNLGDDWGTSVVYVAMSDEQSSFVMERVIIDGGTQLHQGVAIAKSPVFIQAFRADIVGCTFMNMQLYDSTIDANSFCWVSLDPVAGGHIQLERCRFLRITTTGANDINQSVLGQPAASVGSGSISVDNCVFDGSDCVYSTASSDHHMLMILGGSKLITVTRCRFFGGTWFIIVEISRGGINFDNNKFTFKTVPVLALYKIVVLSGGAAENEYGFCSYTNNHVLRTDLRAVGQSPVEIATFERVTVTGNTDMSVGAAAPTNGSIYVAATVANAAISANNVDENIVSNAPATTPGTLTVTNVVA